MNKKSLILTCILPAIVSSTYAAGAVLELSEPFPSIANSAQVGSSVIYTYTLTNRTPQNISVYEAITGNSSSVSVSSPCSLVPANGQCRFQVTVNPKMTDYNTGYIADTVNVLSNGRMPRDISSSLTISSITEPTLDSIVITPNSSTLLGGATYQYKAIGNYGAYSENITNYVTWNSSDTSIATIGTSTGIASTLITGSVNITATRNTVTSNTGTLNISDYIYFANKGITNPYSNNTISFCPVNSSGVIITGSCQNTSITPYNPESIILNPTGEFAYYSSYASSSSGTHYLYVCSVNQSTGALGACTQATPAAHAAGVAFNSNNTFAYVAAPSSGGQALYYCVVSTSNGLLSCQESTSYVPYLASGTGPNSVILSSDNSYLYTVNNSTSTTAGLVTCSLDSNSGAPSSCTGFSSFSTTTATQLLMHPDQTGFYVVNGSAGIAFCSIDSTTQLISSCSTIYTSAATGISIQASNSYAYIVNNATQSSIQQCTVNANHTFSACQTISPMNIYNPTSVCIR